MKRTPIRCAIARWKLAGNEERASGHVASCDACRDFSDSLRSLETSLRAGRSGALPPVSVPPVSSGRRWLLPSVGMVAVAATALVLVVKLGSAPQSEPAEPEASKPAKALALATPASETLSQSASEVLSRVTALRSEVGPLERELAAWREDGLRGFERIRSLGARQ